jgi:hypothetical protein
MARSLFKKSPATVAAKIVIGEAPYLGRAMAEWAEREPDLCLTAIELKQNASRDFDFAPLADCDPKQATAFIAFGDQFLNLRRQELFAKMKNLGFALPPLIDRQAIVANDAAIAENVWIAKGAIIGAGVKIGIGSSIGTAAVIAPDCHIGEYAMIHDGARLGTGCKLGMFGTVGGQTILADHAEFAAFSRIVKAGVYKGTHKNAVFFEDRFEATILP